MDEDNIIHYADANKKNHGRTHYASYKNKEIS